MDATSTEINIDLIREGVNSIMGILVSSACAAKQKYKANGNSIAWYTTSKSSRATVISPTKREKRDRIPSQAPHAPDNRKIPIFILIKEYY